MFKRGWALREKEMYQLGSMQEMESSSSYFTWTLKSWEGLGRIGLQAGRRNASLNSEHCGGADLSWS